MNMQMLNNAAIRSIFSAFNALKIFSNENYDSCELISISVNVHGMILDCSNTCEKFFGYRRRDLVRHHVSTLFFELSEIELIQQEEFNKSLVFLCRCGKLFRAKSRLGDTILCNFNFVHLNNDGENILKMIASPADTTSNNSFNHLKN